MLTADNWTDIVFHISAAQNWAEFDPDNEFVEPYVFLFFVLFTATMEEIYKKMDFG